MLPLSDSMHEIAGWFTISCSEQSACSIGGEEGGRRGGGGQPPTHFSQQIFSVNLHTQNLILRELPPTDIFHKFTYTKFNFEGVAPNKYFP